ncbi:MAG TPA: hypothetical protein VGU20_13105 [Stellaceae bacterium]|nr:hypothetical protein [Stellaceae bacterium]
MDDVAIARALHVLSVVLWIGGVAFVTTVLLPALRRRPAEERLEVFDALERRFSHQARVTTLVAGASGFYMAARLDLWDRFHATAFWWMHGMVLVWLLFTAMLFIAEPLFLHRWLASRARRAPASTFRLVEWLHGCLLALSLVTILGAVAGSHGFFLFG